MKKTISILPLAIILLMSCQNQKKQTLLSDLEAQRAKEQNNIALIEKLLTEGDQKNISYLDEIGDPNYKYYLPSNNTPLGLKEHKQFWEAVNTSFPDLTHSVKEIFAASDKVIARTIVQGTHKDTFAGIAPTGKEVAISQIFICRFEDGKLIEFREEADLLGLYQQLGMELQAKP